MSMIERYGSNHFYKYITSVLVPCPVNKFKMSHEQITKFEINIKDQLLQNKSGFNQNQIIVYSFRKNPFKGCKYEEIGMQLLKLKLIYKCWWTHKEIPV